MQIKPPFSTMLFVDIIKNKIFCCGFMCLCVRINLGRRIMLHLMSVIKVHNKDLAKVRNWVFKCVQGDKLQSCSVHLALVNETQYLLHTHPVQILPVEVYRRQSVNCSTAQRSLESLLSLSAFTRLMACFYISSPSPSRALRKCALLFFFSMFNAKINKQTSPIHLSVLAWPSPRCGRVCSLCTCGPEGLCVVLLPGWSMACLWYWGEMAWTTQPQRAGGDYGGTQSWLGNAAACTCCWVLLGVLLGQRGGRTSHGHCFTGSWGSFLNLLMTCTSSSFHP